MGNSAPRSMNMTSPIQLGIFGWPVAHSKSPQMHEAAAKAVGVELRYERFGVEPNDLADAVRAKHAAGIDGYNLTVPHKQAIMALLDEVDPSARAIGAVNTVVRSGARYVGHNTDAPGFVRSLEEAGVPVGGSVVALIGAGGAARAVVLALADAGAGEVVVINRTKAKAHGAAELAGSVGRVGTMTDVSDAEIVVNATSIGLYPDVDARVALALDSLEPHMDSGSDGWGRRAMTTLFRLGRMRPTGTSWIWPRIVSASSSVSMWCLRPSATISRSHSSRAWALK